MECGTGGESRPGRRVSDTPALRTGRLRLDAPVPVRRAIPHWFMLSSFASVPRPA